MPGENLSAMFRKLHCWNSAVLSIETGAHLVQQRFIAHFNCSATDVENSIGSAFDNREIFPRIAIIFVALAKLHYNMHVSVH